MRPLALSLPLLGLALLASAWETPARACYISPGSPPTVRDFGPDAVVPGNLVYFALAVEGVELALTRQDGSLIAASTRMIGPDRVFAPDEALAPGQRVHLRWRYRTSAGDVIGSDYDFETGPHAGPLTGTPTLQRVAHGVRPDSRQSTGTEAFATVALSESEHGHLYATLFTVDDNYLWTFNLDRRAVTVITPCESAPIGPDLCSLWYSFAPGVHSVRARGHVIGSDVAFDQTLEVFTSCEAEPLDASVEPDASEADASTAGEADATEPTLDASPPLADATAPPADATVPRADASLSREDAGCRVFGSQLDGAWLLLLALRRRRRQ